MLNVEYVDIDLKKTACFGIAGNFTGHLEQAGEDADFKNIKTAEKTAPKAIFPTYIPGADDSLLVPDYLKVFPFDDKKIIFPSGEEKIQIESECALVFDADWENNILKDLKVFGFASSNDVSIRKKGAKKISEKKNWGKSSKGFSSNLIKISSLDSESLISSYRIASFLVRDGNAFEYGEDSPVRGYSYMYGKLLEWMKERFNNQKDEGPQEDINSYLREAHYPEKIMVSIGATRYTPYGENNFLNCGDTAVVILYPEGEYTKDEIKDMALFQKSPHDVSLLAQKVLF